DAAARNGGEPRFHGSGRRGRRRLAAAREQGQAREGGDEARWRSHAEDPLEREAVWPERPLRAVSESMRPSCISMMRSALADSRVSWLTQTTLAPNVRATRCSASMTFLPFTESSALVG